MRAPVSHQAEYQAEFATRMQSCTRKLHQAEVALARTADSKSVVVTVAVTVTVATLEEDLAFQGTEATVEEMEWVAMVEVVAAGRGEARGESLAVATEAWMGLVEVDVEEKVEVVMSVEEVTASEAAKEEMALALAVSAVAVKVKVDVATAAAEWAVEEAAEGDSAAGAWAEAVSEVVVTDAVEKAMAMEAAAGAEAILAEPMAVA